MLNTVFHPAENGGYRVAGVKQFCSLGDAADYYFITGILEGKTSARDGVITAMIPGRDAGVKIEGPGTRPACAARSATPSATTGGGPRQTSSGSPASS